MKKTLKKLLALMVVSVMIVSMCVIPTSAVETQNAVALSVEAQNPATEFAYTVLQDGTVEISGYTGTSSRVVIPSTIDGRSVSYIGNSAFFNNRYISDVTIPCTVTSIGNFAFGYCSALKNIQIPSSVKSVSQNAFSNSDNVSISCIRNTTVSEYAKKNGIDYASFSYNVMPDGTAEISSFLGTSKDVVIPSSVEDYKVTSIGYSAFLFSDVERVTIPQNVTNIGDYAFCQCSCLKDINIPYFVTQIGDYAFAYCSSLASIEIPYGVTTIGEFAFEKCYSLTSITLPSSIKDIYDGAFYHCDSLKTAVLSPTINLTYINKYTFAECASLTEVTIPVAVKYIFDSAFDGCSNLSVIYGRTGSAAEKFAQQKGIDFVEMNSVA